MDVNNIPGAEQIEKIMPVHSKAEVSVDANYTVAFITISEPLNGGLDITYDKCLDALTEHQIRYGIHEDDIKSAIENKLYNENICAARWLAPIDGTDGSINYLYPCTSALAPTENKDGSVNLRDLGLIRNTKANTVIANITLPTEGTPGIDIRNVPVPQIKGSPAVFAIGTNTAVDESGTRLVTLIDGNLRWVENKFIVDETVIIGNDVDASVGNINFIGDIMIKGGVLEGYEITSQKNIVVNGNVNGAKLNASGSVTIRSGGINADITAGGDVKLGFCENSTIKCEGNLESQSFIGCDVFCRGKLTASGKGIIAGGKYTCLNNIEAGTIGSSSYVKTQLTLGNNAVLAEEKNAAEKKIAELEDNVVKLNQIVDILKDQLKKNGQLSPEREQMKVSSLRASLTTQAEIKKIKKRILDIEIELQNNQDMSLSCRRELLPGTSIRINSFTMQVNDTYNHCKAAIDHDGIAIKPF